MVIVRPEMIEALLHPGRNSYLKPLVTGARAVCMVSAEGGLFFITGLRLL